MDLDPGRRVNRYVDFSFPFGYNVVFEGTPLDLYNRLVGRGRFMGVAVTMLLVPQMMVSTKFCNL